MLKKKVCIIGQFAPPIHGLSKAIDTLCKSYLSKKFQLEKINLTNNRAFLKNIILIATSNADLFYFTISQTKGGNLRDLIILKLLEFRKKKCLIHLHGGYYRSLVDNDLSGWQKKMNYNSISKLEGVIVLGNSLKSNFQGMISDDRIHIVPNCVDDEFLMSDEEFKEKLISVKNKDIFHVLYLSNFIKSKGYQEILKIACLEQERCKAGGKNRLHFNFAGKFFEESERNFFFEFIKEHELGNFVTYHGVVSGNQKRNLLKKCDIFCLLTRYPNEGQPISILEAMANGMMVVTTDHAGIPDIVQNDINGIIVKENTPKLVKLYEKILNKNIEQIIKINYSISFSKYQQNSYIKNLKEIFNQVLL